MCGRGEGDDQLPPSACSSYADLRRASSGSVSLSPVMEQLVGLLGQDLLPTMSTIRESASRQVNMSSSMQHHTTLSLLSCWAGVLELSSVICLSSRNFLLVYT